MAALSDRKQRRYVRLMAESQGVKFDRSEDESLSDMERLEAWQSEGDEAPD